MQTTDFLVIGGGIVGLSIARALKHRLPEASVTLLEKEDDVGEHASGRNSGVLHAGFYYSADSLKARFTVEGNRRLTAWCEERGVPVNRTGKLVVARDQSQLDGLDELLRRGQTNGVQLSSISEEEAREIDPRVRTFQRALWSPTTSTVDPARVTREMAAECEELGVDIQRANPFKGRGLGQVVRTARGELEAGMIINCAGLQADLVARQYGFCQHYRVIPFKGLYLYGDHDEELRVQVYPVPDLGMPFLGVHFTVTVDGHVKIGPTALPALWRENYGGVAGMDLADMVGILSREARMFFTDASFRRLARVEVDKMSRRRLVARAAGLLHHIEEAKYTRWGRPGIRAQLWDRRVGQLIMDFVVEGDQHSFHVLNAVSPAFTCALPFADSCLEQMGI